MCYYFQDELEVPVLKTPAVLKLSFAGSPIS